MSVLGLFVAYAFVGLVTTMRLYHRDVVRIGHEPGLPLLAVNVALGILWPLAFVAEVLDAILSDKI